MTAQAPLPALLKEILCAEEWFLKGVHDNSTSLRTFVKAAREWGKHLGRDLADVLGGIEPCLRQSMLMSLVPARAVDPSYHGSIDAAVDEHLTNLGITLGAEERLVLRNLCLHVRRYHGVDAAQARNLTMSLPQLRTTNPGMYDAMRKEQNNRCFWCGVRFDAVGVAEELDHITPKVLGDDMFDGSNWALTCRSCNQGKGESFAWAAQPEAQNYLRRLEFSDVNAIGLPQRWVILARERSCDSCAAGPQDEELWVYRRVKTGLPIPSNCSATCAKCGLHRKCDVLTPRWDQREVTRLIPVW